MVIMFHGINKDASSLDPNDITVQDFNKLMNGLKELGFEAINAIQLADFMEHNAAIPRRAVVLTYDDRHRAEAYEHFRPYWEQWGWPVVNGWISALADDDQFLQENIALGAEGWVDYQAHGVIHNINMGDPVRQTSSFTANSRDQLTISRNTSAKPRLLSSGPVADLAFVAHKLRAKFGYRLGFTVNPRGPIMYNWVPQGDAADPRRPSYIPEGPVNDPLHDIAALIGRHRCWPNWMTIRSDGERSRRICRAEQSD